MSILIFFPPVSGRGSVSGQDPAGPEPRPDGPYKEYYKNGQLKEEGTIKDDLWNYYKTDVTVVRPDDNPNLEPEWEQLQQMEWEDD